MAATTVFRRAGATSIPGPFDQLRTCLPPCQGEGDGERGSLGRDGKAPRAFAGGLRGAVPLALCASKTSTATAIDTRCHRLAFDSGFPSPSDGGRDGKGGRAGRSPARIIRG